MNPVDQRLVVSNGSARPRILEKQPEDLRQVARRVADHNLDPKGVGTCLDERNRLGMAIRIDEEHVALHLGDPPAHRHGFSRRRRFIEQRGVGDGQAGQVAHHRLEVDERLQPPLRDLGLIGGIGRVPTGVLEHVAQDDRRSDGVVVAHPDHGTVDRVPLRDRAQTLDDLHLGQAVSDRQGILETDSRRDRGSHELVDRLVPECLDHVENLLGAWPDVAINEGDTFSHFVPR